MLLEDRVAIVSGIGPGMGRDISLALAREGADLVLAARTESKLDEVASEVEGLGRRALKVPTDISEDEQAARLVAAAQEEYGGLDILVNNAFRVPPFERLDDADTDSWRKSFKVNVFGTMAVTRAAVGAMRDSGGGSIVFINSMSARRIQPEHGIYAASKSALLSAAQTLAQEVGTDGIRVNSVLPGYIWGPSVQWYFEHLAAEKGITPDEQYAEVAAETCLNHIPTSAEIADAVVFFASDLSRVVTGQALNVNAGHWFG